MRTLILATLVLVGTVAAGDKPRKPHPHFNDSGTLRWYKTLAGAQAVAKKEGKLVFIEYGRAL